MRVALVHDDLVQWGGAERVLLGLSEIYPEAPIYTSLYDPLNLSSEFQSKKIITSFLQRIPGWKNFYKVLLPFYGLAFEQFDFSGFDLVISHTTRFAKSIVTKPETKHISYCHTPPRFLWHFSGEGSYGLGDLLLTNLRVYDTISAKRVDHFIAGSKNAQKRVKKIYSRDSIVVYPFVDLERFKNIESFDGGYFLVLARSPKYKRVDLAVKACKDLRVPLKIIGGFKNFKNVTVNGIEILNNLDDEDVVNVLAGCRALIICGEEDFGLTALEAQALGKPVIAYKAGGALETIIEGKTGIFFTVHSKESLKAAILKLDTVNLLPEDCKKNAQNFCKERFIMDFKKAVTSLM